MTMACSYIFQTRMGRCTSSAVVILAATVPAGAVDVAVTYTGPSGGAWLNAANWTPSVVPADDATNFYFVTIPGTGQVVLVGATTISHLDIDPGGTVTAGSLTMAGPSMIVDGSLNLQSTGSKSLRVGLPQLTISGDGSISASAGSSIVGTGGTRTLEIGPGIEMSGSFLLGSNTLRVLNFGIVDATASTGIVFDAAGLPSANDGIFRVAAGRSFTIQNSTLTATGLFESHGSMPIINSSIAGGTFKTIGTGVISIPGNVSTLDGIHNLGEISVLENGRLMLRGTNVNDGIVRYSHSGGTTSIRLDQPLTQLLGSGSVIGEEQGHWLTGITGNEMLVIGRDQVIRGAITIMEMRLDHHGLIESDDSDGMYLTVMGEHGQPGSGGGNHGVIRAGPPPSKGPAPAITFVDCIWDNSGGLFEADGGVIDVANQCEFQGGTYRAVNGGKIQFSATMLGSMPSIVDATIESDSFVELAAAMGGTIVNHSEIHLNGSLRAVEPGVSFQGAGAIRGVGTTAEIGYYDDPKHFIIGPEHTVSGIETFFGAAVTNHGLIEVEGMTTRLYWSGEIDTCFNFGHIRANPTGTIVVFGKFTNEGGLLEADGGLVRNDGHVRGGTIRQSNGGQLQMRGLVEDLVIEGDCFTTPGEPFGIAGQVHMDGELQLQGGSGTKIRVYAPGGSFTGSGRAYFTPSSGNQIAWDTNGDGSALEIGPDFTLVGPFTSSVHLVNRGLLEAPAAASSTIVSGPSLFNDGLMVARAGATLRISSGAEFTNIGTLRADPGGTLQRGGSLFRLDGGRLEVLGEVQANTTTTPRTFELDGDAVVVGDGLLRASDAWFLGGSLQPGSDVAPLTLAGTAIFGDGGRFEAAPIGDDSYSRLVVTGVALLGGTLAVERPEFAPGETEKLFQILSGGIVFGHFDKIESCEPVEVMYGPQSVTLRFVNGPTGDLGGDAEVDGGDLGTLLGQWGPCPGPCCPGDLNGDGVVDEQDLAILLANWTFTLGPSEP